MRAPILISELELTEAITDIELPPREDGEAYDSVQLFIRLQHSPVGYVVLSLDELSAELTSRRVWEELGAAINARRSCAGLPPLAGLSVHGIPIEPSLTD